MTRSENDYWSDWSTAERETLNPDDVQDILAVIALAADLGHWDRQMDKLKKQGYCNGRINCQEEE